jgi:hypothetical protein
MRIQNKWYAKKLYVFRNLREYKFIKIKQHRNRDNSVGVVPSLQTGQHGNQGLRGSSTYYPKDTRNLYPEGKMADY